MLLIVKKQYEEEDFEGDDGNAAAPHTVHLEGAHDAVSQQVMAQLVGKFWYTNGPIRVHQYAFLFLAEC